MMKKLIAGALSVFLLCSSVQQFISSEPMTAYAEDVEYIESTENELVFRIYPDHAEVIGYEQDIPSDVVIPKEIRDVPVTSINRQTFRGCNSMTSIIISDSVTSIGSDAFSYCGNLTEIAIPNTVTSIGDFAFYGTPWLSERQAEDPLVIVNHILIDGSTAEGAVTIPGGVTSIGARAFEYCSNLTSITIPDSVTSIGWSAFEGRSDLTIHAHSGSYAEEYAKENNIPFKSSDQ